MRVCNLGSGSDGNLTYIETKGAKVLLDAGLSATEIKKRLALLQVAPEEINANDPIFGDNGLGLDSIDALELIVLLEKNYGISYQQLIKIN